MTPDNDSMAEGDAPKRPNRRWLRRIAVICGVFLLGIVVAELICRFIVGLGDPPRYHGHETIEYLAEPSASYSRFGNRITFNRWSMRSDEFPEHKSSDDELRVLLIGDSILNGGAHVDQAELATEHLRLRLAEAVDRPVVVGNASAPSWGPANYLAYIQEFGVLDADVVVLVLNGFDAWDVPQGGAEQPGNGRRPTFALEELAQIIRKKMAPRPTTFELESHSSEDVNAALGALTELIDTIERSGAPLAVVLHVNEVEVLDLPTGGSMLIRRVVQDRGVPFHSTRDEYWRVMSATQEPLYLDRLHLTAHGHTVLAEILADAVLELIRSDDDHSHASDR